MLCSSCTGDGPSEEERLRQLDGYLSAATGTAGPPLPPVPPEQQWQVEAQPLFKARRGGAVLCCQPG